MKKKLGIGAIIIGAIYLLACLYFSKYSFPNTKINGADKGNERIDSILEDDYSDYSLDIQGRESQSLRIRGSDIDYKKDPKEGAKHRQNPWAWPLNLFGENDIEVPYDVSFDEEKLADIFDKSSFVREARAPENAKIVAEDGVYKIKEEDNGTTVDFEKAKDIILKAFMAKEDTVSLEGAYKNAEITKEDPKLKERLSWFEKVGDLKLDFNFGDQTESLTGDKLTSMFVEGEDGLEISRDQLRDFIKNLAIKYDTWNTDRKFNATGIGEITVSGSGAMYGWQMNVDKTLENALNMANELKSGEVDIVYNHEAQIRGENDIGPSYVEIDISRQKMWLYKDGQALVETSVVTGKDSTPTPTGIFMIWSREKDRNLSSQNAGGYNSHVDWWIPINYNDVGIHNATWRSNFGGSIYHSSGSHGCINTPTDAMKKVYDNSFVGMPVIVYKS